ncbi:MAG: glycine cleavage system protein GcvH [Firmicutes bacterium]|nr:glycine cleavage system protein GcvH [Bacillota bacterium]
MNFPSDLKYVKSHEWLLDMGDGKVRIGITDYAQDAMGDLVFINLPEVGDPATAGEAICDVESVKAVEDVYSPVSGEILAVNEDLIDHPELMNEQPYDAWIAEIGDVTCMEDLLDAAEYEAFCAEEEA